MSQPDFTKLFFDSLGGTPRKQKFSVRHDACFDHDLKFLSSLIHDAEFTLRDIQRKNKTLTIKLQRDCWEFGRQGKSQQLLTTKSELRISNVASVEWLNKIRDRPSLEDERKLSSLVYEKAQKHEISVLFIGESTYLTDERNPELIFCGYPGWWQLRVKLCHEIWKIVLQDMSDPKVRK